MIKITKENFSIKQISESGQCFRMNQIAENRYGLIAFGKYLELEQEGREISFFCDPQEYDEVWKSYFDLESDYGRYVSTVDDSDRYLSQAVQFGQGIRILNQDIWEVIISFIISQLNHMKRIKRCIEFLCERYGEKKRHGHGGCYYAFPSVEALAGASIEELNECNLGYRSRYVKNTANSILNGEVSLDSLKGVEHVRAKAELMKLCGVGSKVADCICLYGLHHLEAFPVDTHIQQVLERHYLQGFPFASYLGYAGVMQQYIFYYDLMKEEGLQ